MIVMILQKVSPAIRGKLSRYLVETANGVFIGQLSARVKDKLWAECKGNTLDGVIFQAWSTNNEQGFAMRLSGGDRTIVDWEGLSFVIEPARVLSDIEKRRVSGDV